MTTHVETTQHPASVFWRYWTATTTSQVGSAVTAVALPLAALVLLDASALEIGLLVAAGDIGWLLLTLPAGALSTHLPLRGLQAGVDFVRASPCSPRRCCGRSTCSPFRRSTASHS